MPHLQPVNEERICFRPFKAAYCYACPPRPPTPQNITSDLRPISLTSCLAKVIEGFTHELLEQLCNDMDPRKYACHGHSTTHALSTSYKQFTKQWTHEIFLLDFLCWLYEGFRYYRSQYSSERTELSKNRSNLVLLDTCLYYQQNPGSTYVSVRPYHPGGMYMEVAHRGKRYS